MQYLHAGIFQPRARAQVGTRLSASFFGGTASENGGSDFKNGSIKLLIFDCNVVAIKDHAIRQSRGICPRVSYAMPGTDLGYNATSERCWPRLCYYQWY